MDCCSIHPLLTHILPRLFGFQEQYPSSISDAGQGDDGYAEKIQQGSKEWENKTIELNQNIIADRFPYDRAYGNIDLYRFFIATKRKGSCP
jgi:hypothetical protein